jgi:hypothetical protein
MEKLGAGCSWESLESLAQRLLHLLEGHSPHLSTTG